MAKSLIIVESPTKIKTYKNALGAGYEVEASMGHVRDLPEKKLGVDIENDFAPTYETTKDRADVMKRLTAAAKGATNVYFASDPDREGEAIAWHLAEALKIKNPQRIQANELTKPAILHAIANPGTIDMDRVNAQQARRVLDRLVGYKLSPILWKKIQKGLSAGRVQSVAVRIICEREREIMAFVPEEYWSLTATLTPIAPEKRFPFTAKLHSRGGDRLEPKSEETMNGILYDLDGARYDVAEVKKREQRRNAAPPFITSTLQQEASRKLGFSNRRTMSVAQDLYEGIELGELGAVGLITYMRTDSVRIAGEAQAEAIKYITERYDADPKKTPGYRYAPEAP
ncbi:MAG: topoisomerase, partial [Chthonomonadales bacterium]|nr:topoisomerase [Chthonomonadales bacterium]